MQDMQQAGSSRGPERVAREQRFRLRFIEEAKRLAFAHGLSGREARQLIIGFVASRKLQFTFCGASGMPSVEDARKVDHVPDLLGISLFPKALSAAAPALLTLLGAAFREHLPDEALLADDAVGALYQALFSEDKDALAKSAGKIDSKDVLPATVLYTSRPMVDFLLQNTLGRAYPIASSGLSKPWEFFVPPKGRHASPKRPVKSITLFDPACGSGNFLFAAFDLFAAMYLDEGKVPPQDIPAAILENNLFGIDIDSDAVQVARFGLAVKALALRSRALRPGDQLQLGFEANGPKCNVVALDLDAVAAAERNPRCDPGTAAELRRIADLGSLSRPGEGIDSLIADESTRTALSFLRRDYHVVVTNPPFIGFRKLSPNLVRTIKEAFPRAQMDIYVAFVERCRELATAYWGVVTPSSWLTSSKTEELRKVILEEDPLLTFSLGQRTFEDAPLLFVSLFVAGRERRENALRIFQCSKMPNKQSMLEALASPMEWQSTVLRKQSSRPLLPTVPKSLLSQKGKTIGDYFSTTDGFWSGHNARDIRFFWELGPNAGEYVPVSGGKGYARWYRGESMRVRGAVVAALGREARSGAGWEYARVAGGKLSARQITTSSYALAGVVSLLPNSKDARIVDFVGALMNSTLGTAFLRTLVSGLNFNPGYCKKIRLPPDLPTNVELLENVSRCVRECVSQATDREEHDPAVDCFVPLWCRPTGARSVNEYVKNELRREDEGALAALLAEGEIEDALARAYGLDADDKKAIERQVGAHATSYERRDAASLDWEEFVRVLRKGGVDSRGEQPGAVRLPPQSFVEELSLRLGLHPASVFECLERAEREGISSELREVCVLEDLVGTAACHVIGFRWPNAEKVARPEEAWFDVETLRDGIFRAVAHCFPGFEFRSDIDSRLGMPTASWLVRRFPEWLSRTFRNRPPILVFRSGIRAGVRPEASQFVGFTLAAFLDAERLEALLKRTQTARSESSGPLAEIADFQRRIVSVLNGTDGCHISVPWDPGRRAPRRWDPSDHDGIAIKVDSLTRAGLIPSV